jgi:putative hemolysin
MNRADAERLIVKIADNNDEIDAAQALRYEVFYCEQAATATAEQARRKRDFDH